MFNHHHLPPSSLPHDEPSQMRDDDSDGAPTCQHSPVTNRNAATVANTTSNGLHSQTQATSPPAKPPRHPGRARCSAQVSHFLPCQLSKALTAPHCIHYTQSGRWVLHRPFRAYHIISSPPLWQYAPTTHFLPATSSPAPHHPSHFLYVKQDPRFHELRCRMGGGSPTAPLACSMSRL